MRNTKYQIKTSQVVTSIPKKNDFLNQCQIYFNQSINSKKPVNISFSFDSGNEWYDIIHFKELRMTIQNEKTHLATVVNKDSSKSNIQSFSFVKLLVLLLAIYGALMIIDNNFTNIPIYDKLNSNVKNMFFDNKQQLDINAISTEKRVESDSKTKSKITENPKSLGQTCFICNGSGERNCDFCKEGIKSCINCGGQGHHKDGNVCLNCRGNGFVTCNVCEGNYSNYKECFRCDGSGQIQE